MKKIVISLIFISVAVGAVVGMTNAFFSDTETSTGNVFQSGSIDLKIDHTFASYNGIDCDTCQVLPESPNIIANGSFEDPIVTDAKKWDAFPSASVAGWSAEWVSVVGGAQPTEANIEFHRGVSGWLPQDGSQYTELDSDWDGPNGNITNEAALVKIYQDISTESGKKYELRYWHSYRPGQSAQENEMKVFWGDTLLDDITDANGSGKSQTTWKEYVHEVTGDGSTIRLSFVGAGPNNSLGIFLDNVSLKEMTCGSEIAQCNLWTEKDLGRDDWLWNFSDIKPGDYGRDIVSIHVDDNDSWLCSFLSGTDKENTYTEPEISDGDTTSGENEGELSQTLKLFVWWDLNQNGAYEPPTETSIYENGVGAIIPILEPANSPIPGGTTEYMGLAWCAGGQTVNHTTGEITCDGSVVDNKSQTDSFLLDISFYAEQSRNNPDFKCADVVN